MNTARHGRVVALHPLRGKFAKVDKINAAIRLEVSPVAIARSGAVVSKPVVGDYLEVKVIDVAVAVEV